MGAEAALGAVSGATPWGAIAGAGIGAIGSIYGAIKAGKERKKMAAYLSGQEADNEAKFNSDYYGDYTKRADVQAELALMRDTLKDRTQQANSTTAITGATPEAQLAAMEANNAVVGDTMTKISAQGQAFKDRVDDRYMARKSQLSAMKYGEMEGAAQGAENLFANSMGTVGSSVGSIANNLLVPAKGIKKTGLEAFKDTSTPVVEKPLLA
jgi:hypothetical protein